jgi:hypothetical protein
MSPGGLAWTLFFKEQKTLFMLFSQIIMNNLVLTKSSCGKHHAIECTTPIMLISVCITQTVPSPALLTELLLSRHLVGGTLQC